MKQGIDYYPHYTTFSREERDFRYDYGATGLGLYYSILNDIYSTNGYYIKITEQYLKAITSENHITNDENKQDVRMTMKMIGQMLKSGLFSIELYKKYKILTSIEIQRNYMKVVERRVSYEIIEEYLLPFSKPKIENANRNEEIESEMCNNVGENKQSREVKELVNNNINTFSNACVHTCVRVRERTEKERQLFIDYYKWWFMPHVSDLRKNTVLEVIDTMIEALEQSSTINGIRFKERTFYKSDMVKIISTINADRLGSIALSVETKKSYNKAWYILGCVINKGIKETAIKFQDDKFFESLMNNF